MLLCTFGLTATASGDAGLRAVWLGGMLRVPIAGSPEPAAIEITPEFLQEAWAADGIGVGQTQRSDWQVLTSASGRIEGVLQFRHGTSQTVSSVEFALDCPGELPSGDGPWIYEVGVEPKSELEAGLEFWHVSYSAASPAGIAQSGIRISGSFEHVERRQGIGMYEQHSIGISAPPAAELGKAIQVQIYAIDKMGREAVSEVLPGPIVLDRTPPQIVAAYAAPREAGDEDGVLLAGAWATTDTMSLRIWTGDNHRLAHLVYELGAPVGFRDSIIVQSAGNIEYDIPVREEWEGAPQLSIYVRDQAGMTSSVYVSEPDSVRFFPERVAPITSVEVDGAFWDVAADTPRERIVLALNEARAIQFLTVPGLRSVGRVELPGRPLSVDVAPDGAVIAVAAHLPRQILLLDPERPTAGPSAVTLTSVPESFYPTALRFASDGSLVVLVWEMGTYRARLVRYDPKSGVDAVVGGDYLIGARPAAVRSSDYSRLAFYVDRLCGLVYVSDSRAVGPCMEMDENGSMSASGDGSRFARGYRVHDQDLATIDHIGILHAYNTYTTSLTLDGRDLLLGSRKGLTRVSITDPMPRERLRMPPLYNGAVLHWPDGRYLIGAGREPEYGATTTAVHVLDMTAED